MTTIEHLQFKKVRPLFANRSWRNKIHLGTRPDESYKFIYVDTELPSYNETRVRVFENVHHRQLT